MNKFFFFILLLITAPALGQPSKKHSTIDSMSIFNSAVSEEKSGNLKEAIILLKECVAINYKALSSSEMIIYIENELKTPCTENKNKLIERINVTTQTGEFEEAKKHLLKVLQLDPYDDLLYYMLGVAEQNSGNDKDAIHNYSISIELNPNNFDALYNLGAIYFNQAVAKYNLTANEKVPDKYLKLREETKNLFITAKRPFEMALKLQPENQSVKESLAQINQQIERH